ncbi:MAG: hypothetical protein CMIDDMOC_00310 [Sodalis sp. Fle]|nr:MAG: hypothetical protein CMIDDMOC_00310 [Sodalis sp. Fle]
MIDHEYFKFLVGLWQMLFLVASFVGIIMKDGLLILAYFSYLAAGKISSCIRSIVLALVNKCLHVQLRQLADSSR